MKKNKIELFLILVISVILALLFPNFSKFNETIQLPGISEFTILFFIFFVFIALVYFSNKPKEKLTTISDGFQTLYNDRNQITKEGQFIDGKLVNGTKYFYKKNGDLSHTENYKDGVRNNT